MCEVRRLKPNLEQAWVIHSNTWECILFHFHCLFSCPWSWMMAAMMSRLCFERKVKWSQMLVCVCVSWNGFAKRNLDSIRKASYLGWEGINPWQRPSQAVQKYRSWMHVENNLHHRISPAANEVGYLKCMGSSTLGLGNVLWSQSAIVPQASWCFCHPKDMQKEILRAIEQKDILVITWGGRQWLHHRGRSQAARKNRFWMHVEVNIHCRNSPAADELSNLKFMYSSTLGSTMGFRKK